MSLSIDVRSEIGETQEEEGWRKLVCRLARAPCIAILADFWLSRSGYGENRNRWRQDSKAMSRCRGGGRRRELDPGCSVNRQQAWYPVAHVEAGLRSFHRSMPEETNRILTDSISDWLFTSEPSAEENLRRYGIAAARIHMAGSVMIYSLLRHLDRSRKLKARA